MLPNTKPPKLQNINTLVKIVLNIFIAGVAYCIIFEDVSIFVRLSVMDMLFKFFLFEVCFTRYYC